MNYPIELYSLDEIQRQKVEEILEQDRDVIETSERLYTLFKKWQTENGQRLVSGRHENCGHCNIKNLAYEWSKWYVREGWPERS